MTTETIERPSAEDEAERTRLQAAADQALADARDTDPVIAAIMDGAEPEEIDKLDCRRLMVVALQYAHRLAIGAHDNKVGTRMHIERALDAAGEAYQA
jgi:hypothetical protein